jgi:uracil-DNA glycosylase
MTMQSIEPNIEKSWKEKLGSEFQKPYFADLKKFLMHEKSKGAIIYPHGSRIFAAFDHTPFDEVKVVILGQDPYHGPGQANGLCFSVSDGIKPPPSLVNIFKELSDDLKIPVSNSGNLESWARQGVMLLNATLTVRANQPGSHQNHGWENFTDAVIRKLSDERDSLIFLLWGRYAQAKDYLIDAGKHHIFKAPHPSPFSAYNGFFGCHHFSKANAVLAQQGLPEIDWHAGALSNTAEINITGEAI